MTSGILQSYANLEIQSASFRYWVCRACVGIGILSIDLGLMNSQIPSKAAFAHDRWDLDEHATSCAVQSMSQTVCNALYKSSPLSQSWRLRIWELNCLVILATVLLEGGTVSARSRISRAGQQPCLWSNRQFHTTACDFGGNEGRVRQSSLDTDTHLRLCITQPIVVANLL